MNILDSVKVIEEKSGRDFEKLARLCYEESSRKVFEDIAAQVNPNFLLEQWHDKAFARVGGESLSLLVQDKSLVFKGDHRKAVVKIPIWEIREKDEFLSRFRRGVGIQAGLHYRIGQGMPDVYATGDCYFVQEFVKGIDLITFCQRIKDERRIYELIRDLAHLLHLVHSFGFVHRDIKPGNILVCQNAIDKTISPVLIDWGYSMPLEKGDSQITPLESVKKSGRQIGTPLFMSEVAKRNAALCSPKDDIASLGYTLWCAFMRQIPAHDSDYHAGIQSLGDNPPKWCEFFGSCVMGDYGNDILRLEEDITSYLCGEDKAPAIADPPALPPQIITMPRSASMEVLRKIGAIIETTLKKDGVE